MVGPDSPQLRWHEIVPHILHFVLFSLFQLSDFQARMIRHRYKVVTAAAHGKH